MEEEEVRRRDGSGTETTAGIAAAGIAAAGIGVAALAASGPGPPARNVATAPVVAEAVVASRPKRRILQLVPLLGSNLEFRPEWACAGSFVTQNCWILQDHHHRSAP